jgi:hypothetical protein
MGRRGAKYGVRGGRKGGGEATVLTSFRGDVVLRLGSEVGLLGGKGEGGSANMMNRTASQAMVEIVSQDLRRVRSICAWLYDCSTRLRR